VLQKVRDLKKIAILFRVRAMQFASTSDRNFWSLRQFMQGQPYTHFPSFSPLFNLLQRHALRPQGSVGFYFVFVQFVQGFVCSVDVRFCSGQSTAHANRQSASHDWARVLLPSGFADDPLVSITNTSMFVVSRCPQAAAAADAALGVQRHCGDLLPCATTP
jgi:hypothetical protein